jgi:hypothetical protein
MIVPPSIRLVLLVLAGVIPRWQAFFTTSTDYSLRGLAMPLIDSLGIACVIIIARTRNPLVDGEPIEVKAPEGKPLEVKEIDPTTPPTTGSKPWRTGTMDT